MASSPMSPSHVDSSSDEEESLLPALALPDIEALVGPALDNKVAELVIFLFLKYRSNEQTTIAEIVHEIFQGYEEYLPAVFGEVCRYFYLVFGIEVQRVAPPFPCYVLKPALGFTYDGMVNDVPSFPKTILLIIVLSVIFLNGNRASEESIWQVLEGIGVHPGQEHFIYGEPRKFITEDLVCENYLVYQQVPNSDPARYEVVWGPRACIETSKMSILQFLATVKGTSPSDFSLWYEEALREEEERFSPPDPLDLS
ncbi:Melanoma-associated antigen 10 [Fukomys damarensis]|uniref:Melanoma-associated antigen 10 n=2 Tax=Fukomys damarensis TaxID=885580 RepID=A0A091DLT6_FUKDA|nr:Melanoma-associated antigen 10 [Fukomys damarensis]